MIGMALRLVKAFLEHHVSPSDRLDITASIGADEYSDDGQWIATRMNETATIAVKINGGSIDRDRFGKVIGS